MIKAIIHHLNKNTGKYLFLLFSICFMGEVKAQVKQIGTLIGTQGSWGNNSATTIEAAEDGDINTFFDGPSSASWIGYDYGTNPVSLKSVKFYPRSTHAYRMGGNTIYGSNTDTNPANGTLLFTFPPNGTGSGEFDYQGIVNSGSDLHEFIVNETNSYRYIYMTSNNSCNVAELEFYADRTFTHPGLLSTQVDFDRIVDKVGDNANPWMTGWSKLIYNSHAQLNYTPNPVVKLIRGGNSTEEPESDNYAAAFNDAAAAFQCAIRWKVTGDDDYADKSIEILNAWASTCTSLSGNSNIVLGAGIYGYQFANAAEIMRDYQGWSTADFTAFKQWLVDLFLPISKDFLVRHNGTCITHYWANWDLVSIANIMAIAVLTDSETDYNIAIDYLYNGAGNGSLDNAIYYIHPNGLGQMQESGRDQGHTLLCIGMLGEIAQMAWNQGDDLFAYDNNRILKGAEYVAKYNVGMLEVPFEEYTRYYKDPWSICGGTDVHIENGDVGRGAIRPIWELLYNHYVVKKGLSSPYVEMAANENRANGGEGGGGDYGSNSGGFDSLGFGTLLYTLNETVENPEYNNYLTGNLIGHSGSWGNDPDAEIPSAVDGDILTYVDAPSSVGYVGYDLGQGSEVILTSVRYVPRVVTPGRMVGDEIRGANNSDLSDAVTLYTITEEPVVGVYTEATISTTESYRYVYYYSTHFCNLSEIKFYGNNVENLSMRTSSVKFKKNQLKIELNSSTKNVFYINMNDEELEKNFIVLRFYDVFGRFFLVKKEKIKDNILTIKHNLSPGLYIVVINGVTKKILIK
ncbi:alginate lyase family protein [Wenyingzhuangia sp. IMCC45467]